MDNEFNYFSKIKISSSQTNESIPDLVAKSVGLCGSIKMLDVNL